MADSWFYQSGGEQRGPVSFARLRLLVQQRELTPADMVRPSTKEHWVRAGLLTELRADMSGDDLRQHDDVLKSPASIDELLFTDSTPNTQDRSSTSFPQRPQHIQHDNRNELDRLLDALPEVDDVPADAAVAEGHARLSARSRTGRPSSQPDEYYCRVLGTEFGPLSVDETALMVERGELSSGDLVRLGPDGEWREARNAADLQPFFERASAEKRLDTGSAPDSSFHDLLNSAADAAPTDLLGRGQSEPQRQPHEPYQPPPPTDAAPGTDTSQRDAHTSPAESEATERAAKEQNAGVKSKPSTSPVKVKRPIKPAKSKPRKTRVKPKLPITRIRPRPAVIKTADGKPTPAAEKPTGPASVGAQRTVRPTVKKPRKRAGAGGQSGLPNLGGNPLMLAIPAVLILAGGVAWILTSGDSKTTATPVVAQEQSRSFESQSVDQEFYGAYTTYSAIWSEFLAMREREASTAEWTQFTSDSMRKVQPVLPSLASSKDPAKLELYQTGINYLLPILSSESAREQPSHLEPSLTRQLEDAGHAAQQAGFAAPSS